VHLVGQVARELVDRRLVSVRERLPRVLVVVGAVGDQEHPDPQVPWLDLRVVTVLQQRHLSHRAAGETRPDLVVELALDDIKHVPVHRGLPR
jgi:hypothetical protein